MRFGRQLVRNLAETTNVLNTLNGGIVSPVINKRRIESGFQIDIRIPGAQVSDIKIEVHNNLISVVHNMKIHNDYFPVIVPKAVYSQKIPYFIDIKGIKANTHNHGVTVFLPFNKLANGYHKEINIESDL